ncbi:hypothetical protein [Streptomyces jumonjinensis]|uniref:Integral membrane protein n=1 Tax=Streptomyces jumonjinensis TaxID=1945 RepID=A0A646KF04_STRJU|nr:hypothetical protein [Streptomyces jumonjinensis]MQT00708.1 hypothetical protein [Streptomyces jumonjinensis]
MAVVAALVLLTEAVGMVVINGILAAFVDGQSMSLDGLDPAAMVTATWTLGAVSGLFLSVCALVSLLAGVRDRAPGRFGRALLTGAAVAHGVLAAVTVGLVGWPAFAVLMVGMGVVIAVLVLYGKGAAGGPGVESAQSAPERGARPA